MLIQSYSLYPHMPVYDNITFGLQIRTTPTPKIRRRVDESARFLGIESLLAWKLDLLVDLDDLHLFDAETQNAFWSGAA